MKKIIIILIVLLCICITTLIFLIQMNKSNSDEDTLITEAGEAEYTSEFKKVTSYRDYNMVTNCINEYLEEIYYVRNGSELINQNSADTIEEKQQAIYDMLYRPYKESNNINENNIMENVYNINENEIIEVLDIRLIRNERIQTYYIYGNIGQEKVYLILYVDDYNATFAIHPLEEKYNSLEDINVRCEEDEIINNYNNTVLYSDIDKQATCTYYLINYKNKLKNDIEQAYNLLNEEYSKKRFGTIENFREYIENNKEEIDKITLKFYAVNTYEDYTEYVCKDVYENYYIFRITSVLEYTVMLDTYTIDLPEFVKQYEQANEYEKVGLNIQKIFNAINSGDYKYMYDKLDDTFKQTNFETESDLEEYIKANLYTNNKISYVECEKIGNNYIYNITISNKENEEESFSKDIIMQLKEGTDFVMSFNVD